MTLLVDVVILVYILVLNSFGTELDVLRNADLSNTDVKVKHVITITIISKGVQAFFLRQKKNPLPILS